MGNAVTYFQLLKCHWLLYLPPGFQIKKKKPHSAHNMLIFMYSHGKVKISYLYSIKLLVFVTDMRRVYCAVRTKSLNIIQIKFGLQIVKDDINMLYGTENQLTLKAWQGGSTVLAEYARKAASNKDDRQAFKGIDQGSTSAQTHISS
jgi:hypothetical protein